MPRQDFPLFWINLNRDIDRRTKMELALAKGQWSAKRWPATDGMNKANVFASYQRPWQKSSAFPGLLRTMEAESSRCTTRMELACLTSWQMLIENLLTKETRSGWYLLMEDDLGSSLSVPNHWPFTLNELVEQANDNVLAIQMAPINGRVRHELYGLWKSSRGDQLLVPKTTVRSHGNGALLLNQKAIPLLSRRLGRWIERLMPNIHLLGHPRDVRPVADKWLYASLPLDSCWVSTFPIFCLEARTSSLHQEHVHTFHQASRRVTLDLWNSGGHQALIDAEKDWRATQI